MECQCDGLSMLSADYRIVSHLARDLIIAIISTAPCVTDKGELTTLYDINKNPYIKPKTNNAIVIFTKSTKMHTLNLKLIML